MSLRNRVQGFLLRRHRRRCARIREMLARTPAPSPEDTPPPYKDPARPVTERVADLLSRMTLEEKVAQMSMPWHFSSALAALPLGFWPVGTRTNERLGIPPFYTTGSSRTAGIFATAFPVAIARGASWDPELERRVHSAIGAEAKAMGANVLLAPCINLVRHPGWGRSQETYGEDTCHLSRFAVAAVQGAQEHVLAQIKHFALNNVEEDRYAIDATIDERALREVYLPQFQAAVTEGRAASVMSAYNKINGTHCSENKHLLQEILKGDWKFDGFVMSDWVRGVWSTAASVNNGLEMEMASSVHFGRRLLKAVRAGEVTEQTIENSAVRLLRKMFEFGLFEKAPEVHLDQINSQEHRALAREAAQKSAVLLKNEGPVLPLAQGENLRLAVIGRYANKARLGDICSSSTNWAQGAVTPYQGIKQANSMGRTDLYAGRSPKKAARVAANADAAVVVVGLSPLDEGEKIDRLLPPGGDRRSLSLHKRDIEIIRAVAAVCKEVIVVIEAGSVVTMEEWIEEVPAVLLAWYPGLEGGNAIADIIFGKANPSGKLPLSVPRTQEHLPPLQTGQPRAAHALLHGYRHLDARAHEPRFPFGFGLSYSRFNLHKLELSATVLSQGEDLRVSFEVTNQGNRAGAEVAQLYLSCKGSKIDRAPKELKGFAKIDLEPGESRRVTLTLAPKDLAYWDVSRNDWTVETAAYEVHVGTSSRDLPLVASIEWVERPITQAAAGAAQS